MPLFGHSDPYQGISVSRCRPRAIHRLLTMRLHFSTAKNGPHILGPTACRGPRCSGWSAHPCAASTGAGPSGHVRRRRGCRRRPSRPRRGGGSTAVVDRAGTGGESGRRRGRTPRAFDRTHAAGLRTACDSAPGGDGGTGARATLSTRGSRVMVASTASSAGTLWGWTGSTCKRRIAARVTSSAAPRSRGSSARSWAPRVAVEYSSRRRRSTPARSSRPSG